MVNTITSMQKMTMSRSLPTSSLEYQSLTPVSPVHKTKAILIPSSMDFEPQIVFENPDKIFSSVFKKEKCFTIFFKEDFHMYFPSMEQYIGADVNRVATFLVRQKHLQMYGNVPPEIVCGNVVLFGTRNLLTNSIDNKDHSCSYRLITEVVKTYDILKNN